MRVLRQGDAGGTDPEVAPSGSALYLSTADPNGAPRRPLNRWLRLVIRLATIAAVASLSTRVPLPLIDNWLPVRNVMIAVAAIMLIGRALYDTLFFDHYWP